MSHRSALASTATVFAIAGLVGFGAAGYRLVSGSCPFSCHGCEAAAGQTKMISHAAGTAACPSGQCGDAAACPAGCPDQPGCPDQAGCPAAGGCPAAKGLAGTIQAEAKPAPTAPATGG